MLPLLDERLSYFDTAHPKFTHNWKGVLLKSPPHSTMAVGLHELQKLAQLSDSVINAKCKEIGANLKSEYYPHSATFDAVLTYLLFHLLIMKRNYESAYAMEYLNYLKQSS